jgi:hypothetical protein
MRKELRLLHGRGKALKTLKEILGKYNALPKEQMSVTMLCKKVKFGNTEMLDMTTLRLELLTHMNSITLFLNLLALGSQMVVLKCMRNHRAQLSEAQQSIKWPTAKQASKSRRFG